MIYVRIFLFYVLTIRLECERGKNPQRRKRLSTRSEFLVDNILWSDPDEGVTGWKVNSRGAGILFSKDIAHDFLDKNGLDVYILFLN